MGKQELWMSWLLSWDDLGIAVSSTVLASKICYPGQTSLGVHVHLMFMLVLAWRTSSVNREGHRKREKASG